MPEARRPIALDFLLRAAFAAVAYFLLLLLAMACVPVFLGAEVHPALASAERTLCALTLDSVPEILVGGDSRAKMQVDPAVLSAETGMSSLNVGEPLPMGGDLATLERILRRYPKVLEGRPVLILSVSAPGLDDLNLADLTTAVMLNWTLRDHVRIALRRPAEWWRIMRTRYLRSASRLAWRRIVSDSFTCDEGVRIPAQVAESRGFWPDRDTMTVLHTGSGWKPGGYLTDGAAWREFRVALRRLAASPVRAVVLYNAPIIPAWKDDPRNAEEMELENRVSALIGTEAARNPKIHWIDFVRDPPAGLEPAHYSDAHHLKERGAEIFTRILARRLAEVDSSGR